MKKMDELIIVGARVLLVIVMMGWVGQRWMLWLVIMWDIAKMGWSHAGAIPVCSESIDDPQSH